MSASSLRKFLQPPALPVPSSPASVSMPFGANSYSGTPQVNCYSGTSDRRPPLPFGCSIPTAERCDLDCRAVLLHAVHNDHPLQFTSSPLRTAVYVLSFLKKIKIKLQVYAEPSLVRTGSPHSAEEHRTLVPLQKGD